MDKSAPWTVLRGTLTISAISATTTGFLGVIRGQEHNGMLAGSAAVNSGITAATFFGLREYIISPILVYTIPTSQYERRRHELGLNNSTPENEGVPSGQSRISFSDMRGNKLLDSAFSGIATGGILRGWRGGPKVALSGALTVGAICTALQLGYNEIGVQRLKYLTPHQEPVASVPMVQTEDTTVEPTSWKARILSLWGIRRMSEEEYLRRLKLQREHHLLRIAALEKKLEEEQKREEKS